MNFVFRFVQPSAQFNLEASSGVILTTVDMNTSALYRLEVEAYDLGSPSLTSRGESVQVDL